MIGNKLCLSCTEKQICIELLPVDRSYNNNNNNAVGL